MPVSVSCACGKQLRVPDQYVGRRVKCPACGEGIQVEEDSAPEMLIADEAPRQIRFKCGNCGKEMQAKAEYAGKQTKCPGCQSMVKIEDMSASAAPKAKPRVAAPKVKAVVEDEEEEEAPVRRPSSKKKKAKPPKRALWPWILAGVASLLVIAGVVLFLIFGLGGGGGSDGKLTDLDILPADAVAVVSFKIGEVWKKPAVQQMMQAVPAMNMQTQQAKDFLPGIGPEDVTRMTLVFTTLNPISPEVFLAIQSSKPIARDKYLNSLKRNNTMTVADKTAGGRKYQALTRTQGFGGGKTEAAHLFNDYLMVYGDETDIIKVLERGAKVNKAGPLADALKRVAGADQMVVAGNPPADMMNQLVAAMQAQLDDVPCQAVKEAQQLLLTVNLNEKLDVELSGVLPDGPKAEQVKKALQAGKDKLAIIIGFGAAFLPPPAIKSLSASLKATTIEQNDKNIQVKMSLDPQVLSNAAK